MRPEDNGEPLAAPEEAAAVGQTENSPASEEAEIPASASENEKLAGMPDTVPDVSAEELPPIVSRLDLLTQAIENHPEAPANYVIRGEVLLEGGDYELAAQDFETALNLANPLAESSNWGYINQALMDRARQGLRQCIKYIDNKDHNHLGQNTDESRREDE